MTRRVAVLVDWQNTFNCAREAFHDAQHDPARYGNVRVKAFASLLVAKGEKGDQLTFIGVYRGEPDPRKDPQTHAAHLRQRQAWVNECGDLVTVRTRALKYRPGRHVSEAEEKGIDVQLAVDAMVMALRDQYDLAIIASADTDLLPVVEGLLALRENVGRPEVAVIGWARTSAHMTAKDVAVRWMGPKDYEQVRDLTDYNISPSERRLRGTR